MNGRGELRRARLFLRPRHRAIFRRMDRLDAFLSVHDALRADKPRPSSTGRSFVAAVLAASDDPIALLEQIRPLPEMLSRSMSRWNRPSNDLLWVHAALLGREDKAPEVWIGARDALDGERKTGKQRALHDAGATAALVLTLTAAPSLSRITRFFEIREAIRQPWWRREAQQEDSFAALFAARDAAASAVERDVAKAREAFQVVRGSEAAKEAAAVISVLAGVEPATSAMAFTRLRALKREDRKRLRPIPERALAELSVRPDATESLARMGALQSALRERKRHMVSTTRGWVAYLLTAGAEAASPTAALSGLQAILAAQAAMIAATSGAAAAAVTSSS